MLMQIKKRILPILLIVVMLFCSMGATFVDRETIGRRYTVTENGITYYIQSTYSKNKTRIIINTSQDRDYTEIGIDKLNNTVTSTYHDYKGRGFFGAPQYRETRRSIDCSELNDQSTDSVLLQSISYGSKNTEQLYYKYSYWYGSESTKTYLKIKCSATYQIRTDNLSTTKKDNCNAYTSAIKKINSSIATVRAYAALAGIGTTLLLGVVAVCIIFPPATIVAAVIAAVGGATAGGVGVLVKSAVDAALVAFDKYNDVKDLYITIRSYGVKL